MLLGRERRAPGARPAAGRRARRAERRARARRRARDRQDRAARLRRRRGRRDAGAARPRHRVGGAGSVRRAARAAAPRAGALDRIPGAAGGRARRRARAAARRARRTGSPSARRPSACSPPTPRSAPLARAGRRRPLARRVERRGAALRLPPARRRPDRGRARRARGASRRCSTAPTCRCCASPVSTALDAADCSARVAVRSAGSPTGSTAPRRATRSRCSSWLPDAPARGGAARRRPCRLGEHRRTRSCAASTRCRATTRGAARARRRERRRRADACSSAPPALLGLDRRALAAAEGAGLVRLARRPLEFRHPLARSAVYGAASPGRAARRAPRARRRAARPRRRPPCLASRRGRGRHRRGRVRRAASRPRTRARARSAYVGRRDGVRAGRAPRARARVAAAPAPLRRRRRAWLGGPARPRAGAARRGARGARPELALAARIEHLRGRIADAARAGDAQPRPARRSRRARRGRATRRWPSRCSPRPRRLLLRRRDAADAGAPRTAPPSWPPAAGERAAFFAAIAQGMALIFAAAARRARTRCASATAILEASDELRDDPLPARLGRPWRRSGCARRDAGRALVDRAVEAGPRAARRSASCRALLLARRPRRRRRPTVAGRARPAITRRSGWPARPGSAPSSPRRSPGLAWLEARQGKEEHCRAHAAEARELCARARHAASRDLGDRGARRARARPAAGRRRRSSTSRPSRPRSTTLGIADVDLLPAPELVEVYLRLGRPDDAARGLRRVRGAGARRRASRGRSRAPRAAAACSPPTTSSRRASTRRCACTSRRPTSSRPPAPASPTAPGCGARASGFGPARSCAPRSRSSTGSAPRRGRTRPSAELAATGETARRRDRARSTRSRRRSFRSRCSWPTAGRPARPPPRSSSARRRSSTTCATSTASSPSARARSSRRSWARFGFRSSAPLIQPAAEPGSGRAFGEEAPELRPGGHPLFEPVEAEELVRRVELLVGRREREEQRLHAQRLLEDDGSGQRPADPDEQRLRGRVDGLQRPHCGEHRGMVGADRVGGHAAGLSDDPHRDAARHVHGDVRRTAGRSARDPGPGRAGR